MQVNIWLEAFCLRRVFCWPARYPYPFVLRTKRPLPLKQRGLSS